MLIWGTHLSDSILMVLSNLRVNGKGYSFCTSLTSGFSFCIWSSSDCKLDISKGDVGLSLFPDWQHGWLTFLPSAVNDCSSSLPRPYVFLYSLTDLLCTFALPRIFSYSIYLLGILHKFLDLKSTYTRSVVSPRSSSWALLGVVDILPVMVILIPNCSMIPFIYWWSME